MPPGPSLQQAFHFDAGRIAWPRYRTVPSRAAEQAASCAEAFYLNWHSRYDQFIRRWGQMYAMDQTLPLPGWDGMAG
jgi:hypothetical protein